MKKVIILSGVSGSGKSTYAKKLWNELEPGQYSTIVSADDYFMASDGECLEYKFDPSKLGIAHGVCFRNFLEAIDSEKGYSLVIVDNTNTTSEEIAPYVLGAQAFGWEPEIHTLRVQGALRKDNNGMVIARSSALMDKLVKRNKHGVTAKTIQAQANRLTMRMLPPWWKHIDILTVI